MNLFSDPETIARLRERLELLSGYSLSKLFEEGFIGNAAPDRAAFNLERWLASTSNPGLYLNQLVGKRARLLLTVLGASQPVADCLIQNPELASLVFDPEALARRPTRAEVVEEGMTLLRSSSSYSHALDRLRFLRQRWNLVTVLNDLAGSWTQAEVWQAISDLADGLIELAYRHVWMVFAKDKKYEGDCPVLVVAFGKLAGHELNYSSDVDLVYAVADGLDERTERDVTKYCETLGRALSDRMGRGYLYRVDLRLRPYGSAGPILRSMRAVEGYYERYAESWEIQALLRSRPIAGPSDLARRWNEMRDHHCFRPRTSETAVESMLAMRARIETGAAENDLKRGRGGIRDIEFLVQILQIVHGHEDRQITTTNTLAAIDALELHQILDFDSSEQLRSGYTFLRKLEHRVQMLDDRQTHDIPDGELARFAIANLMGFPGVAALLDDLAARRDRIHRLYKASLRAVSSALPHRNAVLERLHKESPGLIRSLSSWFDVLSDSEAYYRALEENPDSLQRVTNLIEFGPDLLSAFRGSVALTELVLSGEIDDPIEPGSRVRRLPASAPASLVAEVYRSAHTILCTQWLLGQDFELEAALGELLESLVLHVIGRNDPGMDVFALGSFATGEVSPHSDADLLLLVDSADKHPIAESAAQNILAFLAELRRNDLDIKFDLRLRPDGGKGFLVRTYDGFHAYDLSDMEMWERFALGHFRPIRASATAIDRVYQAAYGLPLTPERLKELIKMKRRVETERVSPQNVDRDIKLGRGGLNDIEWAVHLIEMRYPGAIAATQATPTGRFDMRIRNLGKANLLNILEVDQLLEARRHYLDLRAHLSLQGISDNLMPENPDKLDRLARAMGCPNGNDLLARTGVTQRFVRGLYDDTLGRLRA